MQPDHPHEDEVYAAVTDGLRSCGLAPSVLALLLEQEPAPEQEQRVVPTLVELCAHVVVEHHGDAAARLARDARLALDTRKLLRRLHRHTTALRQHRSRSSPPPSTAPAASPHLVRGVPARPFARSLARLLRCWMVHGTVPLEFPAQAVLQETAPFALDALHDRVLDLASSWRLLDDAARGREFAALFGACGVPGILRMLNVRRTAGSAEGMFPPSHGTLLRAFNARHSKGGEEVELTVGGRAWSKHCGRDVTNGWWGAATGGAVVVNAHAEEIILRILDHATWTNLHILAHDVIVFEVRVTEGYGARWSADGSQFRGFLEPHAVYGALLLLPPLLTIPSATATTRAGFTESARRAALFHWFTFAKHHVLSSACVVCSLNSSASSDTRS